MKKLALTAALLGVCLPFGAAAAEVPKDAQLEINAKVVDSCTFKFDMPVINFLIAKDNFSGAEQKSSFTLQCGSGNTKVSLNSGQHGSEGTRLLGRADGGAGTIPYNVYAGPNTAAPIWNDSNNRYAVTEEEARTGAPKVFLVVIPKASVSPQMQTGDYKDTLLATLTYDTPPAGE